MNALLVTLHVIVCIALILIVLLQRGKGAEMGAAFGGSSQTLFGSRGATTFLGKLTTTAAIIFMLTSLALAYVSTKRIGGGGGSVIDGATLPKPAQTAPAQAPVAPPTEQPKEIPASPAQAK